MHRSACAGIKVHRRHDFIAWEILPRAAMREIDAAAMKRKRVF